SAVTTGGTRAETPSQSAWEELALAYEALAQHNGSASRVQRLLQVVDVWERGADDLDRAFEVLARAFREDPDDAQVRGTIEKLGAGRGAWDRICALYLKLIDEGGSAHRSLELHLEVARIRELQGRQDEAETQFAQVLAIDPSHEGALARLEELYRQN